MYLVVTYVPSKIGMDVKNNPVPVCVAVCAAVVTNLYSTLLIVVVNAVPAFMVAVPSAVSLSVTFTSALGALTDLGS